MTTHRYVQRVLKEYCNLPDTPNRARKNDRLLAAALHDQNVGFEIVIAALRLATLRRNRRPASAPSLEPIRSLHYFFPVIQELQRQQVDDVYLAYINSRFEDLS